MATRIEIGKLYEFEAALALDAQGWLILDQRRRNRRGELDIVALERCPEEGRILVFVEVKARLTRGFAEGLELLSPTKQRRLVRSAELFLAQSRIDATGLRFDLMTWEEGVLTHFRDVVVV